MRRAHAIVQIVVIEQNRDKQNSGKSTLQLLMPHERCVRISNSTSLGMTAVGLRMLRGDYARQLPKGTIFSRKWGADGEPVADAGVPIPQIRALGEIGHRFIVLSHEVEEVMPFWMLESDTVCTRGPTPRQRSRSHRFRWVYRPRRNTGIGIP